MNARKRRTKVFSFYPGSFWLKRAAFIAIMFTIGFNQFMDVVQEDIIDESKKFIAEAEKIRDTGNKYGGVSDDLASYFKRSGSSKVDDADIESLLAWADRKIGKAIGKSDFRLPRPKEIDNDVKSIKEFDQAISEYSLFFQSAAKIIEWTNIFIWFSIIGIAAPWLFLHMIYGTKYDRQFTFNWLLIAAVFNAVVLHWLTTTYQADKQAFWGKVSGISEVFMPYLQQ